MNAVYDEINKEIEAAQEEMELTGTRLQDSKCYFFYFKWSFNQFSLRFVGCQTLGTLAQLTKVTFYLFLVKTIARVRTPNMNRTKGPIQGYFHKQPLPTPLSPCGFPKTLLEDIMYFYSLISYLNYSNCD